MKQISFTHRRGGPPIQFKYEDGKLRVRERDGVAADQTYVSMTGYVAMLVDEYGAEALRQIADLYPPEAT